MVGIKRLYIIMDAHDAQTITHMPMKRRVRRKLDSLLGSGELTESGLSWLTQATDPFHDMPIICEGYPDMSTTNSLVQVISLNMTAVKPTSLVSGGTWDCHVFFNPVSPPLVVNNTTGGGTGPASVDNRLYRSQLTNQGALRNLDATQYIYGGVNVLSCATGQNWITGSVANPANGDVSIPVRTNSGAWRLIGAAFEVVNTTATLYKGGTIINYRSPASKTVTHTNTPDFIVDGLEQITDVVALPPSTPAEAALYPTSRTWGAEEGCYTVCVLNDSDVVYNRSVSGRSALAIRDIDISALTTGIPTRTVYCPLFSTSSVTQFASPMNCALPFDVSGCVMTGLNENTTLSVSVRYMFERIPTVAEPDLLVLTRPPASSDPLALELYSRLMSQLPVAVRVADNPAGEWWNTILDGLEAVIPAVGGALSGLTGGLSIPVSAAASLGLAGIRKASDNWEKNNPNPSGTQVARRQRGQKRNRNSKAVVVTVPTKAQAERMQSLADKARAKRKKKKPSNNQNKKSQRRRGVLYI